MKVFLKLERLLDFEMLQSRWLFILPRSDFIDPGVRTAENQDVEIARPQPVWGNLCNYLRVGGLRIWKHVEREDSGVRTEVSLGRQGMRGPHVGPDPHRRNRWREGREGV